MKRRKIYRFSEAASRGFSACLLCGVLALSGCTLRHMYGGARMPADWIARLEPGQDKGEVLELLGPPDTVGIRLNGSIFIYRYHNENNKGLELSPGGGSFTYEAAERKTDRLVVFFDKKGRMTDFAAY